MTTPLEVSLASILADPARVSTAPQVVNRLSRDFYWYSPVLRRQLDGKVADVVVHPLTVQEIQDVLRYCYANDIPVTPRGAGTGNYGQAVPLHGGVVLDLSRMDQIESISRRWRRDLPAGCAPGRFGRPKHARLDGNCVAIPPQSSRPRWEAFWAEVPEVSAR